MPTNIPFSSTTAEPESPVSENTSPVASGAMLIILFSVFPPSDGTVAVTSK
jgi:hypothetical protein